MKIIFSVFSLALLNFFPPLSGESFSIPDTLSVEEIFFSWSTSFVIKSEGEELATVYRTSFSFLPEYNLKNSNDELLAVAKMQLWSLGATFEVEDGCGSPLGKVEEKLSFFSTTFDILSPAERILAHAELSFWGTEYRISDPADGHLIALLKRPFFHFFNDWQVEICDPRAIAENQIHPHLFLVLIAFQVDLEKWESMLLANESRALAKREPCNSVENQLREELLKKIASYRFYCESCYPTKSDFETIEAIEAEEEFAAAVSRYVELFDSENLSLEEKAALYLMLESRLKSPYPLLKAQ